MTDDQPQRGGPDRQVHQEDPAPVGVRGEHSAQARPGHRRHRPHRGQPGLDPRALRQWVQIGGQRLHGALQRPAAQSLHDPERDQRGHVPGRRAQRRAQQEHGRPRDQHRFAAEGVGQLAVDGERDGHGQQIAREEPGEDGEPAEVTDDLRYRRGDDGGVQRGQRHRQHQRGDHRAPPPGVPSSDRTAAYRGCRTPHRAPLPGTPRRNLPLASIRGTTACHAAAVLTLTRREGGGFPRRRVEMPLRAPPPGGGAPLGVSPYYGSGRLRPGGGRDGPGALLNLALRRWGAADHTGGVGFSPGKEGAPHQSAAAPPTARLDGVPRTTPRHTGASPAHRTDLHRTDLLTDIGDIP